MRENTQVRDSAVDDLPVRAAIYARLSQDRTGQGVQVQRQVADSLELCQRLGLTVVATFVDDDISAYSGKRRPQFEDMVARLGDGEFDAIVAYHVNRLYRQVKDLERLIRIIGENPESGIQIQTVKSADLDLSTSSGRMVARITGAIAQGQSEESSERIQRALLEKAKDGESHHGPRPFGYEADSTICQTEASELVDAARKLIAGELTLYGIAKDLNNRNIVTTQGKPWQPTTLKKCLLKPRNAGLRQHRGDVIGDAKWEPIFDVATRNKLVRILERGNPNGSGSKGGPRAKYLGTQLYVCGVCGQPRMTRNVEHRVASYRCTNRNAPGTGVHVGRQADPLDAYVEGKLFKVLKRDGFIEGMCAVMYGDDVHTAKLLAEQRQIQSDLEELKAARKAGKISMTLFISGGEDLETRGGDIITELESLSNGSSLEVLRDGIRKGKSVNDLWDTELTINQQRAILAETLTITILPIGQKAGPKFKPGTRTYKEAINIQTTEKARQVIARQARPHGHGQLSEAVPTYGIIDGVE